MGFVDPSQVRPKFTSSIIANYTVGVAPTSLLGSKFKAVAKRTLYLEWLVKRFGSTVAADTVRGAEGNLNQFSNITRKIDKPPYFYEKINVTQQMGYDRAFPDSGKIDESIYNDFRKTIMEEIMHVQFKIDRAREIYAQQVLTTGSITPIIAEATNFNRKSASMIGYDSSWDWTNANVDPRDVLEKACLFQVTYGQSTDIIYDCYMALDAYDALINNPIIFKNQQFFVNELNTEVTRESNGGSYMKTITCGSFRVRLITYPQFYTPYGVADLTGASMVPYLANGTIIVSPANPMWMCGYTVPPRLPGELMTGIPEGFTQGMAGSIDGRYYITEYLDVPRRGWFIGIESCFMTIPIAVDQMYNAKVTPA